MKVVSGLSRRREQHYPGATVRLTSEADEQRNRATETKLGRIETAEAGQELREPSQGQLPRGKKLTRRRALILGGLGALVAAGGGSVFWLSRGGRSTAPAGTIRDFRVKDTGASPRLVVARGPNPANNVAAALSRVGGMRRWIARGDIVLVKPNIGWDRTVLQAGNTNPEVVRSVVKACLDAGAAEVIVADNPVHEFMRTFQRSGIAAAAREAGARVVMPNELEQRSVTIPGKPGHWSVLEPLVRVTKVINLPIAKHHASTQLTAGMKNWIGAVTGDRHRLHVGIHESVVGLATLIRPTLTVLDATRVLLRNGPAGGNLDDLKALNAVAVGLDPVALDAWAASELGFDLRTIKYLELAEKAGLGTVDFRSVGLVEITA